MNDRGASDASASSRDPPGYDSDGPQTLSDVETFITRGFLIDENRYADSSERQRTQRVVLRLRKSFAAIDHPSKLLLDDDTSSIEGVCASTPESETQEHERPVEDVNDTASFTSSQLSSMIGDVAAHAVARNVRPQPTRAPLKNRISSLRSIDSIAKLLGSDASDLDESEITRMSDDERDARSAASTSPNLEQIVLPLLDVVTHDVRGSFGATPDDSRPSLKTLAVQFRWRRSVTYCSTHRTSTASGPCGTRILAVLLTAFSLREGRQGVKTSSPMIAWLRPSSPSSYSVLSSRTWKPRSREREKNLPAAGTSGRTISLTTTPDTSTWFE